LDKNTGDMASAWVVRCRFHQGNQKYVGVIIGNSDNLCREKEAKTSFTEAILEMDRFRGSRKVRQNMK
jgi:hypothetical protein